MKNEEAAPKKRGPKPRRAGQVKQFPIRLTVGEIAAFNAVARSRGLATSRMIRILTGLEVDPAQIADALRAAISRQAARRAEKVGT